MKIVTRGLEADKKAEKRRLVEWGYNPVAPDLAVEIISSTDNQAQVRRKRAIYAAGGVLAWLVYPRHGRVQVYAPDAPVEIKYAGDTLDRGNVLPGFTMVLQ